MLSEKQLGYITYLVKCATFRNEKFDKFIKSLRTAKDYDNSINRLEVKSKQLNGLQASEVINDLLNDNYDNVLRTFENL